MSHRPLCSGSFHSAVTVIRENVADVLDGAELGFDERHRHPTLDGQLVEPVDISGIRLRIEERVDDAFRRDAEGRPRGLQFSMRAIRDALRLVAWARREGLTP